MYKHQHGSDAGFVLRNSDIFKENIIKALPNQESFVSKYVASIFYKTREISINL